MAMNPNKFKKVVVCGYDEAKKLIGRPTFVSALQLNDSTYEVTSRCQTVKEATPLQIALTVYDLSKLNLLRFYFNCLRAYLVWQMFELVLCDTDR